jgi:FG-GAP-like repeat
MSPKTIAALLFLALSASHPALASSNIMQLKAWDYPGGGSSNRLFRAVAAGDFNGDGIDEWALMKREHSQILIVRSPADSELEIKLAFDVDLTNSELIGVAAGDLDGDRDDELIVLRNAPAGTQVSNVIVYNIAANWAVTQMASIKYVDGAYTWKGVACADFDADGRSEIVVARDGSSSLLSILQLTSTNNALVARATLNLPSSTPIAAVAAGDLDGDKRAEIAVVRQATGSDKDFLFYKVTTSGAWAVVAAGAFNWNGGTTHYPWAGVAIGEFDLDKTNGQEFVTYKNSSSYFHFQNYRGASTAPEVIGTEAYSSETQHPWTGIAAGDAMLNNGHDELVMVRQHPGAAGRTMALCGDAVTVSTLKQAAFERGYFHFGSITQIYMPTLHTAAGLNPAQVIRYAEDNHLQTITILMVDYYLDNQSAPFSFTPEGSTYNAVVELLNQLKANNSPLKVIVNMWPVWDGKPYNMPNAGDSPHIGAAELGAGITDEQTLFPSGDPGNFVAWFKLLGIVGAKFPNLIGISFDDYSHYVGAGQHSWTHLGRMIKALREHSELVAFVPTVYHELTKSSFAWRKEIRNYVDGYVFYSRNDKHKYSATLVPPDVLRPSGTAHNMHGVVVLPQSMYSIGMNTMNEEISDMVAYVNDPTKLFISGIYAVSHSKSTTLATPQGVAGQMEVAYGNANVDGVAMFLMNDPASPVGATVYEQFHDWYMVDDYFNNFGAGGGSPPGWTVTTAANTTCTLQGAPTTNNGAMRFTDNSTSGRASAKRSLGGAFTAIVSAQWRFMQTNLRPQQMFVRGFGVNAIELATGTGNLDYIDHAGVSRPLLAISANRWYTVKVVANSSTNRADIYVDGVLRAAAVQYRNATLGLDEIYFATHSTAGDPAYTVWIDAVSVAAGP